MSRITKKQLNRVSYKSGNKLKQYFLSCLLLLLSNSATGLTCSELDGAWVEARDFSLTYLGFFGSSYADDSINNPYGSYGSSSYSDSNSVRNSTGLFGSSYGTYSANNSSAILPPKIMKNGEWIGTLTTSSFIYGRISLSEIDANCNFSSTSPQRGLVPTDLYYINSTPDINTIYLEWLGGIGASGYAVYQCATSACVSQTFINATGYNFITVTGLSPQSTYHFRVVPYNSAGIGYWLDISSTTLSNAPVPSPLTSLNASAQETTANLTWSGGGGATGFNVYSCPDISCNLSGLMGSASGYSISITGLSPGTTYYYAVQPYNENGNGQYLSVSVTTLADNTAPVITLIGSSLVTIEVGETYADEGATATDNIDSSVNIVTSGAVGNEVGTYTLTYSATDASGNTAADVYRTVVVEAAEEETIPVILRLSDTVSGAAEVRMTGPWWSWDPNGGPEAVDNGDGTWTVTLDPAPTDNMEYLWVVDGVQENLIDNAAGAECSAEIDGGSLITDYSGWANRVLVVGSGDASNTYDACAGTPPPVVDSDGDGIPDDLEIASGRNPQGVDYAVGTGNKFSCALDSNGVTCWGGNQYGQRAAPALSNPTELSVGFEHACAIDDSGVICWGRGHQGQTTVPALSNPTALAAAKTHTCAIDDSGVVCWGSNGFKRSEVPETLVNATQIDAGVEHTCAIGDNGVECWGRNHKQQRKVPAGLVNPTQVSAGYIHSCAIDDNGVTCWGTQQDSRAVVPDTLVNPTQVSAGGLSTCAIDDNGVTCWGAANIIAVPTLVNPTQVSVDFNHACAQDDTGVVCWGSNDKGKRTPVGLSHVTDNDGDGLSDADELLLGTDKLVADTDGDSVPDGSDYMPLDAGETADTDGDGIGNNADADDDNDGIPDTLETETGRNPLAVDYMVGTGNKFACALDSNGVTCWGANQYGQRAAPALSNPTELSVGFEHACAIDDSGVVCWGRGHQGQTTVPVLSNPTALAAAKTHTCAVDDTGVVCWGSDGFKRSTVPTSLTNATQIDAGVEHSCAIGDNGVECWGRNHKQQRKVPAGLVNPTQVSAGYIHSCAIDDSGVRCWGTQQDSRAVVPVGLVNPAQVSAGGLSTCAIDDNGVTCWGAPNIVNVPSLSNPTQVTVGFNHACAQDDTGVVCWGNNDKGKRTVPTLEHIKDSDGDGVDDAIDGDRLNAAVQ